MSARNDFHEVMKNLSCAAGWLSCARLDVEASDEPGQLEIDSLAEDIANLYDRCKSMFFRYSNVS